MYKLKEKERSLSSVYLEKLASEGARATTLLQILPLPEKVEEDEALTASHSFFNSTSELSEEHRQVVFARVDQILRIV